MFSLLLNFGKYFWVFPTIIVLILHTINPNFLDRVIGLFWDSFKEIGVHPMFEPMVAVYSFGVWIVYFDLVIDSVKSFRKYKFFGSQTRCTSWNSFLSPIVYMMFVKFGLLALEKTTGLPSSSCANPTLWKLVVEVLLGLFLYDFFFYFIHRFYHTTKSSVLRDYHRQHHENKNQCARETVNHSLVDGVLQVLVNVFVQQLTPFGGIGAKHPLSRILHNVFVTYLICEAHSGYNCPWFTHNLFPWVLGGSSSHEKHHHYYNCCFQQFFKYYERFDPEKYKDVEIKIERKEDDMNWSNVSKFWDYFTVVVVNQSLITILLLLF